MLAGLVISCMWTHVCFAPHNNGKRKTSTTEQKEPAVQEQPQARQEPASTQAAAPAAQAPAPQIAETPVPAPAAPIAAASITQATAAAAASVSPKDTQAFTYLKGAIPETPASWFTWKKLSIILNLLRKKELTAAITSNRVRTEHDLDWAIQECIEQKLNDALLEIITLCADQGVKINESSLVAASRYSQEQLKQEVSDLQKTQEQYFVRIKKMKAAQKLVSPIKSTQETDGDSDVEDYTPQYIFTKTQMAKILAPQVAIAAAVAATTIPAELHAPDVKVEQQAT